MTRVVVLGGGVGGITAAAKLSKELAGRAEVTLIEKEGTHHFQPSYTWVMMGWRTPDPISRPLSRLKARNLKVRQEEVLAIEPAERRVRTSAGVLPYDYLLIALGAELDPHAIEGFADAAHHPYDLAGAIRLGEALREFKGGKVAVGISRLPFKCPAAPYETALLMDYSFRRKGIRDRVEMEFFTPEPWPTPAAGEGIGKAIEGMLKERDIPLSTKVGMESIDTESRIVHFKGDAQAAYDLLVAVPPHTTCEAVRAS
ncbi:MAG: NAD(P)/FAD-dependent oxidoreductase, partial [Nitrososphaerota archaeon]|nr:NAD(P)/FAD-dependent oxidoreductase [Nitrososphaerota archaeon]